MNIIKNIGLVGAIGAVLVMCVGLLLFEFAPTSVNIESANKYEVEKETTEILSDSKNAKDLLSSQNLSSKTNSEQNKTVKTNIVLKEYDISKTDLAIYKQSGSYKNGRPDPFAEVTAVQANTGNGSSSGNQEGSESGSSSSSSSGSGANTGSGSSSTGNSSGVQSDGTFYNSTRTK